MITDIEEETQDIDWFSADLDGRIAHFATGGHGFMPPSVKASRENLDRLFAYFREQAPMRCAAVESPNLSSHAQFHSQAKKATYVASFFRMATRGLYSFNCVFAPVRPSGYFSVASPSRPISIDELPPDLQQILDLTRFRGRFSDVDTIDEREIL